MPKIIHLRFTIESSAINVRAFLPEAGYSIAHSKSQSLDVLNRVYGWYQSIAAQRSFASENDAGIILALKALGAEIYSLFLAGFEELLSDGVELVLEHENFFFPFEFAYDGQQFLGLKYAIENRILGSLGDKGLRENYWNPLVPLKGVRDCLIIGTGDRSILPRFRSQNRWRTTVTTDRDDCIDLLRNSNIDVLHFSGHGLSTEREPSDLLLSVFEPSEWSLSCRQLERSWRHPPHLLFLNACSLGPLRDEHRGFLDLAHLFLSLGVDRLVVPMWSISDRAAAEFAARFYDSLFAGNKTADALREARLGGWAAGDSSLTSLSYVLLSRAESHAPSSVS